jgi:hypothetical protein
MAIMKQIFLLLIGLAGVRGMYTSSEAGDSVPFTSVKTPRSWVSADVQTYRIVTEGNWSQYYSSPPAGADFAKCIYVVTSRGSQPNPGFRIKILTITQEKEKIHVSVELLQPDPNREYVQMIVTPAAVVEIEKKQLQPLPQYEFIFTDQRGRQLATQTITP